MTIPSPSGAPQCTACLGNRKCWVCLGQGRSERADRSYATCSRCHGTGACSACRPVVTDESRPSLPAEASGPVIRLDGAAPLRLEAADLPGPVFS